MRLTKLGKLALAVALCLVLGLATTAAATPVVVPGFTPGIYVGGQFFGFNADGVAAGAIGDLSFNASFTNIGDPAILWSVNATNATAAPVDIAVLFGFFSNPDNVPASQLSSTSGVSLTDFGDGAASVVPFDLFGFPQTVPPSIATNYTGFLDGDLIVVTDAWGTNPGFAHAITNGTDVESYAFVGLGDGSIPTLFWEVVGFTLSANDSTALSGNCSFVPVPASVLLFGSGMLGMGLLGWRRRLG
jgi:hypothetical protein